LLFFPNFLLRCCRDVEVTILKPFSQTIPAKKTESSVKLEWTSLSLAYALADLAESTSTTGQFRSAGTLA
jgi:hypothetical protein